MLGLARSGAAQPPGGAELTTAAFLEKRVPDELATEGIVLSRRNLALRLEQLGDKWLVSLVDLTTGRAAASTKVDVLPADREAAVAVMTHVVAELAAQIVGRAELPSAPVAAPPVSPTVEEILREQQAERAERAARAASEATELAFHRRLIRFTDSYQPTPNARHDTQRVRWAAYQGAPDEKLDPLTFYREVGRPDLADAYVGRKHLMIGGFVVGAAAIVSSYFLLFYEISKPFDCDALIGSAEYDQCKADNAPSYTLPLIAFGVGTISIITGIHYALHRQPIDETEARALADAYNQRLSGRAGAPVPSKSQLLRDVQLVPYATGRTAGLVLGGRF